MFDLKSTRQGPVLFYFTLSILVVPKCILWQTVKTQIKCRIMQHFIRVWTICQDKNNLQRKKIQFYLDNITCHPSIYTMDNLKFIVPNMKEKSISAYRVNKALTKGSHCIVFTVIR